MPYPANVETAIKVEEVVSANGALPATIAVIKGQPTIGLDRDELELLGRTGPGAMKVSRRDLAVGMARGATGGTTVSGTMLLASLAGIEVFGTGGLGGVHRKGHETMDISADLTELGRTPVAVVCAGPKAILDIERTAEYLETQGVTVCTVGDAPINIPAFYSRDSGVKSPYATSVAEAAAMINANRTIGLKSGMLICNPIEEEHALSFDTMERVISTALSKAEQAGIGGKDITPYLLDEVIQATGGKSLQANIALILHNAKVAAQIAVHLAALRRGSFQEEEMAATSPLSVAPRSSAVPARALAIGSVALDSTSTLLHAPSTLLGTSHPGNTIDTPGGVAHNVALAAHRLLGPGIRLVSCVGEDASGDSLLRKLEQEGLDISSIKRTKGPTARYSSVHSMEGDLLLAVADMESLERGLDEATIGDALDRARPMWAAFDGNLGIKSMAALVSRGRGTKLFFEPTSAPKSRRLFQALVAPHQPFPSWSVQVSTPNARELGEMYDEAAGSGLLEHESWWEAVDAFGVDATFRAELEALTQARAGDLGDMLQAGIPQQAIHLLPIIPNLCVKLGPAGVLVFQAGRLVEERTDVREGRVVARGPAGLRIHHFPAREAKEIVSVTGAGDSFAGSLLASLVQDDQALTQHLSRTIARAQEAAVLALASPFAVSEQLSCK